MAIYKEAPFTKVTQLTNSSVSKLVASKGAGKELQQFADNAAALAGGLVAGDLYVTSGTGAAPLNAAGIIMIVV
jgi:hypothetical protein